MKRIALVLIALWVVPALAAEPATTHEHPVIKAPPTFERMKSLLGTWEGKTNAGKATTSFELAANGSAILERLAPMGEDAMINVYHPDGDALVMTHYCGSGNQPRMRCTKDGDQLAFTMTDITNWKPGEIRMSAVTIVMVDANHMNQVWTSEQGGKTDSFTIEFTRKK